MRLPVVDAIKSVVHGEHASKRLGPARVVSRQRDTPAKMPGIASVRLTTYFVEIGCTVEVPTPTNDKATAASRRRAEALLCRALFGEIENSIREVRDMAYMCGCDTDMMEKLDDLVMLVRGEDTAS